MLVSRATLIRSCMSGLRLSVFIRDTRTEVHHHRHDLTTLELRGQPPNHYTTLPPKHLQACYLFPVRNCFFVLLFFFFKLCVEAVLACDLCSGAVCMCSAAEARLARTRTQLFGARGSKRWTSGRILRFVDTPVWTESPNHFHRGAGESDPPQLITSVI